MLLRREDRLVLTIGDVVEEFVGIDARRLSIRRGWFGRALVADGAAFGKLRKSFMSYTQKLWMRVRKKAAYLPGC
ncbi:MAG: hypothetical protein R2736_17255 [Solirubrobacterales bacterium]